MSEIVGGAIFMGLFIGFVIWRHKNKQPAENLDQKINAEQFWTEREAQEPAIVSSDTLNDD